LPTETVYGLGADAANPAAVAKIFAAKGRPADHPLIVHLPGRAPRALGARHPPKPQRSPRAFWPGPLTLILKRRPQVPDAVTGGQDTVGLRVPNHPLALQLLRAFDGGVAAPSANRFGRISPTTAAHVREELGERVPLILDGGACQVGIESTILDLSQASPHPAPGHARCKVAIAGILGATPEFGGSQDAPRVSGSLEAHYAPQTPLRLGTTDKLGEAVRIALQAGKSVAVARRPPHRPLPTNASHWCTAAS
jgi:L-threonylcarbamoyladenylate synthase